jgi:phosphoglycolate phosphatase
MSSKANLWTLVFDLDGTLVDSAPDLISTLNAVLDTDALPALPLAQGRDLIGHGARALLRRGYETAGAPLTDEALDVRFALFLDLYVGRIAELTRPYPGCVAALTALKTEGYTLAVATNKRTDLAVALLEALGLTDLFACVFGPDRVSARKPDGAHLVETIATAGGHSDRALMVGDSSLDAGAAHAADLPFVAVRFGYADVPIPGMTPWAVLDHYDAFPAMVARCVDEREQALALAGSAG